MVKHYKQVHQLYDDLGLPIDQSFEFTIHDLLRIHNEIPYSSPVFRADYFSFIFIKEGTGQYTTGPHQFDYNAPVLYFTNPCHLKSFTFHELKKGYLITLSESFLRENVHAAIFENFPFLLSETIPPQEMSQERYAEFETIYLQLLNEYQTSSKYKKELIGNLFVVLLLKIKEYYWESYRPLEEGSRSSQIVQTFRTHLEEHFVKLTSGEVDESWRVSDYAEQQHLTASYFNQVIKSKTGKTVGDWIAEKTMTHARALLKNSTLPISQIAYRLGFSEPAHFSNYFKKQAAESPTSFRKKPHS